MSSRSVDESASENDCSAGKAKRNADDSECHPDDEKRLSDTVHILYLPRSSSFMFSSQRFSSSLLMRSCAVAWLLEFFSTSSSTKIGQSIRSARARASLGRES